MNDLLIRQKIEAMILYGYIALRQFPKAERHVLSQEIRQTMWELLRQVIVCNHRYHKKTRIASWLGHARHADSYRIRTKLLTSAVFRRSQ